MQVPRFWSHRDQPAYDATKINWTPASGFEQVSKVPGETDRMAFDIWLPSILSLPRQDQDLDQHHQRELLKETCSDISSGLWILLGAKVQECQSSDHPLFPLQIHIARWRPGGVAGGFCPSWIGSTGPWWKMTPNISKHGSGKGIGQLFNSGVCGLTHASPRKVHETDMCLGRSQARGSRRVGRSRMELRNHARFFLYLPMLRIAC